MSSSGDALVETRFVRQTNAPFVCQKFVEILAVFRVDNYIVA